METHPVSTLHTYNPNASKSIASSASITYKDIENYTKSASSSISNFPWWYWLIFVLILAFFGINIFIYLAQGTQILANITNYFAPIFINITQWFGNLTLQTTKQITTIGALGATTGINAVAGTINSGATALQQSGGTNNSVNGVSNTNVSPNQGTNQGTNINALKPPSSDNNNELNAALNNAAQTPEYMADETSSSLTMSKATNKSGWCYIGEEKGYRSCIDVGANDMCMSGDIFPSKDICVNPSLR